MKKMIISVMCLFFVLPVMVAQTDKTQLGLDIQAKYKSNFELISQYTWQRETEFFENNVAKLRTISAVTIGPDGKAVVQVIEKKSLQKTGNSVLADSKQEDSMRMYVNDALSLVSEYIFMSQEQMVDLFNKGTVSLLDDNIQVQAFNFLVEGDNLSFLYKMNTKNCVRQTVNTVMNGDIVKAEVVYKTLDDLTMVKQISLELPAKGVRGVAVNSKWAKKL